ncbi:hypothetical protein [uncultured Megasphaera sp.]|uniref:hypothetical protein n=1 Tax=uncultured Megasphaera sp. TaxID=165188 RepID=UPI002670A0C6|nr:hypothetical protein [uncultured Megasphaera sp.]
MSYILFIIVAIIALLVLFLALSIAGTLVMVVLGTALLIVQIVYYFLLILLRHAMLIVGFGALFYAAMPNRAAMAGVIVFAVVLLSWTVRNDAKKAVIRHLQEDIQKTGVIPADDDSLFAFVKRDGFRKIDIWALRHWGPGDIKAYLIDECTASRLKITGADREYYFVSPQTIREQWPALKEKDAIPQNWFHPDMSSKGFASIIVAIEEACPDVPLEDSFQGVSNPLEPAFLLRKDLVPAHTCERCQKIFLKLETLKEHHYCHTCRQWLEDHTCDLCGKLFTNELNHHGSRTFCDPCLAIIKNAEEKQTTVRRVVDEEDVPLAVRRRLE